MTLLWTSSPPEATARPPAVGGMCIQIRPDPHFNFLAFSHPDIPNKGTLRPSIKTQRKIR
jgi:hypothetical protein